MKYMMRSLMFTSVAMLGSALTSAHAVEIAVWHSLSGPNRASFEALVSEFNRQSKGVSVDLTRFASQQALVEAAQKALKGDRAKPDLVQLHDTHAPEVIAQHREVMPLHQLLARHPIRDASWFLEKTTSFVRDANGRLLAFPFMAEIPVMFYNLDAYRNAKLDVKKPAQTWAELQSHLLELRNVARFECPYASAQQVNVHIENLAPINDELYLKPENGLGKGKNLTFNFGTLYMRHLSLMVSWKKTDLLVLSTDDSEPDRAFAEGRCAVLTSTSSALGTLRSARVPFGVAPIPFYPQETKTPNAPFVGGGALWVLNGHSAERNKATADFLGYLATPVVAAKWHQETGFLPLTDAAYRAADVRFYDRTPGARDLIETMQKAKNKDSRGFRAPHYPRARAILNTGFNRAINNELPPMSALDEAKVPAERMINTGK